MVHAGTSVMGIYAGVGVRPRLTTFWARAEPMGAPDEFDW